MDLVTSSSSDIMNDNESDDEKLDTKPVEPGAEPDETDSKVKTNTPRAILIKSWDNEMSHKEACDALLGYNATRLDDDEDVESLKYMASYQRQFLTLLERAVIVSKANIVNNLQLIQTIGMSLISGAAWWRMEYTEDTVQDRAGFIFFFGTFWFFMTLFQGMMQFLPERAIMLKERAGGSYHLSAYFLSKTLSETPVRLSLPLLYLAICYPMSNLDPSILTFIGVCGTQLLAALAGESIGLFIGTSTMDYEKAMVTATLVSLALMLCGGYYVQNLPPFISWVRYLSPFKYSYDACVQLSFRRDIPCDDGAILIQCSETANIGGDVSGTVAVEYLGSTESVATNLFMLVIFIVFFRILSYISLKYIPHNNGRK